MRAARSRRHSAPRCWPRRGSIARSCRRTWPARAAPASCAACTSSAPPHAQDKLIQVVAGRIFDVAVDIRPGSPSLGRWVGAHLDADEPRLLFVPRGFAHGYLTLSDDCAVAYKVSDYYAPQAEGGIAWNDPALAIDWPLPASAITTNPRDATWPPFADVMAALA